MLMLISCSRPRREVKMSSRSQHYGFQSATMVQSANGGHAYLFGNNASENDLSEEDGESYELRPRGRERLRRSTSKERLEDIIYLSRDIQEGDTLNSIALQYHCPVSLSMYIVGAEQLRTGENMWCNVWSSRCATAPPTLKENILAQFELVCRYMQNDTIKSTYFKTLLLKKRKCWECGNLV